MITEDGTVIEKTGKVYRIKINRTVACEGCHACLFSSDKSYMIAEAYSGIEVNEGDRVRIERINTSKSKAGFFMFILPLLFFIAGFNLGNFLIASFQPGTYTSDITDLINILSGIVFFCIPLIILKLLSKKEQFKMKIVQKL